MIFFQHSSPSSGNITLQAGLLANTQMLIALGFLFCSLLYNGILYDNVVSVTQP
jgi:hypothetical protein